MNRSALKAVVIALLAAGAVVVVAGTVDDVRTGGSNGDVGPEAQEDPTETRTETSTTTGNQNESTEISTREAQCIEALQHPLAILGLLGAWGGVVALTYRRHGQLEALSVFMMICVFLLIVYPLFTACGSQVRQQAENRSGEPPEERNDTDDEVPVGGEGAGDEGEATPDFPLILVAIVAVVGATAVGAVLLTREDGDDEEPFDGAEEAIEEGAEDVDVDRFAAAAGRAADRIERTGDVDNEIYRSWVEMTQHIDVSHPETSTPGEFAAAAVDAGVDREDVVELTELFERTRYGHEEPTADREARALEALRRIEAQYGGESE